MLYAASSRQLGYKEYELQKCLANTRRVELEELCARLEIVSSIFKALAR